ncbi:hypothetical protein [Corynebacterium faecium]|uniref:hypothetical protein n=1 Tax=Corynebacterium faecium TaxID=3016001 RepID=UPI0022B53EBB|nr:hypothetical protein [Corynebacterium faecium]
MRNFRNAAVATATAITLAATGTSIALAETTDAADASDRVVTHTGNQSSVAFQGTKQKDDKTFGEVISDGTKGVFSGAGSSHYVTKEDAQTRFDIRDAAGKETNVENMPQWARLWVDGTIVAGIGALVGLVIAGVNYASYNGWIQLPNFNF